jgi:glutathione S-transferase
MWALEELRLPFEREDIGGEFGRNREPDFLALNPNGLVPVLIDGPTALWESNTILRYLAARYGVDSPRESPLWQPDAAKRALIERWLDWQLSLATPAVSLLTRALVLNPAKVVPADDLERAKRQLADATRIVDQHLGNRRFLEGERFSLADIAIGVIAYRERGLPIVRESLPNLQRWYEELAAREAFVKSIPI